MILPKRAGIIETIHLNDVQLLAVSVTMATHLKNLDRLINTIRGYSRVDYIGIVVGGYVFKQNPGLWKKFDVNSFADDAQTAIDVIDELYRGLNNG